MADISKIKVLDGSTYAIKDETARASAANKVSYTESQSLTSAQQSTARSNIGVGDMASSEATTGTATTAKMISPSVLKEAIVAHQYWQYNSTTDSVDLIFPT